MLGVAYTIFVYLLFSSGDEKLMILVGDVAGKTALIIGTWWAAEEGG